MRTAYWLRARCAWRLLPHDLPPWQTVYPVLSLPSVRTEAQTWLIFTMMLGYRVSYVVVDAAEAALRPAALAKETATFLGVLTSAQGAGSILGGLVVGRLLRARGTLATGVVGALVFAAGAALRCLPWWPATVASSLVIGIGLPWTLVAAVTAVQTGTPERLLGRVAATANTLLFAPVAIANPIGAGLILLDHRVPLALAAGVCVAAGFAAVRLDRRRYDEAGTLRPGDAAALGPDCGTPVRSGHETAVRP
ncbi:MFS transporter [Plantactinospora sp. B5E13]|uniref:MFS transporter n=1 Tax=Plantactinospora sp. B5E13 TaxID=3153758 RepID=UPI00325CCCE3